MSDDFDTEDSTRNTGVAEGQTTSTKSCFNCGFETITNLSVCHTRCNNCGVESGCDDK